MKTPLLFAAVLFLPACAQKNNRSVNASAVINTIKIHDTVYINNQNKQDWQMKFNLSHEKDKDTIWHKPAKYYLDDEDCAGIASDFYYGSFRPSDDGATKDLLKLAITPNKKLRPFYRWCLNCTLIISDGALGELTGVPARQYAETYPDEFFEYLDDEKDSTQYKLWTETINYSGFFDYEDYDDMNANQKKLIVSMTKHLKNPSEKNTARIKRFAKDCTKIIIN